MLSDSRLPHCWRKSNAPGNPRSPQPIESLQMTRTRTKLSPELTSRIVDLVRAGNYVETAAKAAGIHKSTYYSWMRRGEETAEAENRGDPVADADPGFAEFYRQVSQAEGQAEADAVAAVREADRGWQAHMTYLERRFATRWRQ